MKVEKFEDLNVWQLSRTLIVEIYKITSNKNFKKDYGLSNQIQRASVSVLSNIDKEVSSMGYEVGDEEVTTEHQSNRAPEEKVATFASEPLNFSTIKQFFYKRSER